MFIIVAVSAYASHAQSCVPGCCKKTCEAAKTETASVSSLRSDLQTVITKMSQSSWGFDKQVTDLTLKNCVCDAEGLRYLSTVATTVRRAFVEKIEPSKLVASLKDQASPSSHETLAGLQKEIQLLTAQADLL